MISTAKRLANQRNSQKSTGPKTESGKATVSRNACKHGLTSKENIILPGQESAFTELEAGLRHDLQPRGTLQEILFETILHAAWNVRRCRQFLAQLQAEAPDPTVDVFHDSSRSQEFHRVEMYRRRYESSFNRAIKEFRTLQKEATHRECHQMPGEASVLVNTTSFKPEPEVSPQPGAQPEFPPQQAPEKTKPPVSLPPFVELQLAEYETTLAQAVLKRLGTRA